MDFTLYHLVHGVGFVSLKSPLSVYLWLGEAVRESAMWCHCGAEARAGHCWRQYERHFGGAASVREAA